MQSTKVRQGGAALAQVFRTLLVWAVAVVMAGSLSPSAAAAGFDGTSGSAGEEHCVIPLGQAVGIKLFSQGVLVVGLTDVTTDQGPASPAKNCGLREGDVITHIDGTQVSSIEEVQSILQTARDREVELQVLRDETNQDLTAHAVQCSADGAYKLGAWIRDSMAGIGTLTFVDPESGLFGTLGHGINDVDTSVLMKLQSGAITPASVASVVKGQDGQPGELRGSFAADTDLGTLYANTEQGVFGHLTNPGAFHGTPVPVAAPEDIHVGSATILANIVGSEVKEYSVEILKVYNDATDTRDLMLQVTDPELLAQTGGIVQGMSGSPILQDGKLVGAVTHVLIDHADRGYGILAQHMIDAAAEAQH